jgi:hypothetical protein
LRPTHAAQPRRQDEAAGQRTVEALLGDPHEDFVRALDHSLAADILPGATGEPAPCDQSLALQVIEDLRLRPLAANVAIGHDDERRPHMSLYKGDGLSRLDQERLALIHRQESFDDRAMGRPVPRSLAQRSVDDEIVRVFADCQDVFEKAWKRLLAPALCTQRRAARYRKARMTGVGLRHQPSVSA